MVPRSQERQPRLRPGSPRSSMRGRVLGKVLLTLLGAVLLLETVPRFVDVPGLEPETLDPPYLDSAEDRAFEPHPYLIFTPKPGYSREVNAERSFSHSASGFRAPDVPLAKPAGTVRIACLGGSSTYGTGPSRDDTTWTSQLAATLNASPGETAFDVLNGGVPSWNSFECLGNLAFRVLPYDPDVVLVYLSTNDAETALWPDPAADNSHYRLAWPTYRPSPIEGVLERSVLYLTWRKYATNYLEQRADLGFVGKVVPDGDAGQRLARYEEPAIDGPLPEQAFESFRRNLVSMVAISRAHGATPVLMTQALWSPDPASNHLLHGRLRLLAHARMTTIVREVAAETETALVEMKGFLEDEAQRQFATTGTQTLFANNVHLTDEGAALFAKRLAEELRRLGIV
ncbi:MAG: SGNH/GDSL hydrolase family protein [Planctomycetota bacterium]